MILEEYFKDKIVKVDNLFGAGIKLDSNKVKVNICDKKSILEAIITVAEKGIAYYKGFGLLNDTEVSKCTVVEGSNLIGNHYVDCHSIYDIYDSITYMKEYEEFRSFVILCNSEHKLLAGIDEIFGTPIIFIEDIPNDIILIHGVSDEKIFAKSKDKYELIGRKELMLLNCK